MPPTLVAQIFGQLAPVVIVSSAAHLLLSCPIFGQLGVRCLPADPNGYAEVASTVSGTAGVAPAALAHDLNGQQAQALVHVLEAASCTVQVFFVALCLPSTTDGDDAASLAAFAIRQWGTRIVQRADGVAPLGRMLHATRGRRMTMCAPLGLRIGVRPRLQHYQD